MNSGYTIVYHPLAEKEYYESILWYEENKTGLGERFIKEVENSLNHIENNPYEYAVKKFFYEKLL